MDVMVGAEQDGAIADRLRPDVLAAANINPPEPFALSYAENMITSSNTDILLEAPRS